MIEALGLHVHYGASHVLHGVDFRVGEGECVCLMGRNGMGKTTLLKALMGLVPVSGGRVFIDGREVTGAEPSAIARLGLGWVPEGRGIFPAVTVREHLEMAARPGGWTVERVLATFPRLAERLTHLGAHLSGGEQQMLSIGRALTTNPRLLILDEATEGLAPLVRRDIWRVVGEIRAAGIAAVIVDRDAATLTGLADRAVVLVKGRVEYEGPAAALAEMPDLLHRYLGV